MTQRPNLMLVSFLLGHGPQDDPRVVSCVTEEDATTLVLQDRKPDYFRGASAEFLDGWTWQFISDDLACETTTIVMNRKTRHAIVSGGVCCLNDLPLTVKEVRTVGLHCSRAYPMIMTEAGVFLLHPQLRAKVGDRLVCNLGSGVEYLGSEKEIPCIQIAFGQHWSASQASLISKHWDAGL